MRRFTEAYPEFMQHAVSKFDRDLAVPIVQALLAQLQEIGHAATVQ
jgi:hypothetical protein